MRIKNHTEVPANEVTMEGAAGCRVRWLIGEDDQAPNFAMREFEVAPGGHTPKHFHDYEHEVYVLAGQRRRSSTATTSGRSPPATSSSSPRTTSTNSATPAASRCGSSA